MILCDTNILIEFYKGNAEIAAALNSIGVPDLAVSQITVGELYFGARDKRELKRMQESLAMLLHLPVDEHISSLHLNLLEKYALSHRLSIPDALIAATALHYTIPLFTLNLKDFRYISGLKIYKG